MVQEKIRVDPRRLGAGVVDYDKLGAAIMRQAGLNAAKEIGYKHDASGEPDADYLHGPGGLLRYPGVDPAVFQTIIGDMGLLSQVQWMPSLYANPTYEVITGVTGDEVANGGSEPAEPCDDAPEAGVKKGALITAPYGLYKRGTQEMDIRRLGQRVDRADPTDLFLVGTPLNNPGFPGTGMEGMMFTPDVLVNEMANQLSNRAIAMHRLLTRQVWQGDPSNNNMGGGYKEFAGLLQLINTGYKDLLTGTAAPAMDSDVWDFGFNRVDSTTVQANGFTAASNLVQEMQYAFRTRRSIAMRTGVEPVRWAWVMQEALFYEITKVWPIAYLTGAQTVIDASGVRLTVDAGDQVSMRDQMRQGRYLVLDGMQIDVIFDDGIPLVNHDQAGGDAASVPTGCFSTSIFLVPFSVLGGRSVLYGEYMQYQNPSINTVLGMPVLARVVGPFIETPRQTNTCIVFDISLEPRIILRTPWLCSRIDHVVFCPAEMTRQPFPDDSYFVNGGVVGGRPGPDYDSNNVWN